MNLTKIKVEHYNALVKTIKSCEAGSRTNGALACTNITLQAIIDTLRECSDDCDSYQDVAENILSKIDELAEQLS